MNKTAEALVLLRKRKGVTQNELATKLGVSSQAVSKWERGENLPDSMLLLDIAKFYGVSIEEILSGNIEEHNGDDKTKFNFMIMVASVIIMLAIVSFLVLMTVQMTVAILTSIVLIAIGVFIILYVGLQSER